MANTGEPGLVLGFGGVPEAAIIRGVQTLAVVLADITRARGSSDRLKKGKR
jgi:GntR family transcriptional regulator/MocR family aminotransferase